MAAEFKTVNIKIVASGAGVKKGTDEAKGHLQQLEGHAKASSHSMAHTFSSVFGAGAGGNIFGGLSSLLTGFGAGAGLMAGFHVVETGIDKILERGHEAIEISHDAEKTGLSQGALTGFKFKSPSQFEPLINAATKYNALIGSAASGNEQAQKTLHKWGLEWENLIQMDPEGAMAAAFDQVEKLDTTFSKSSMLRELFGRGGVDILRTAEKGGGIFDKMAAFSAAHGTTPSNADMETFKSIEAEKKSFKADLAGFWDHPLDRMRHTGLRMMGLGGDVDKEIEDRKLQLEMERFVKKQKAIDQGKKELEAQRQETARAQDEALRAEANKIEEANKNRDDAKFGGIENAFGFTNSEDLNSQLETLRSGLLGGDLNSRTAGLAGLDLLQKQEARLGLNKPATPNIASAIQSGSVEAANVINRAMAENTPDKDIAERLLDVQLENKKRDDDQSKNIEQMRKLLDAGVAIIPGKVF